MSNTYFVGYRCSNCFAVYLCRVEKGIASPNILICCCCKIKALTKVPPMGLKDYTVVVIEGKTVVPIEK